MRKHNHAGKSKYEKENYARGVKKVSIEGTIPIEQPFTTDTTDEELAPPISGTKGKNKPRRSKRNRFKLHLKEHWVNYLFGMAIFACTYFVIESKISFAEVKKDISYSEKAISNNESLLGEIENKFDSIASEIKSLSDRFDLFIKLTMKKEP